MTGEDLYTKWRFAMADEGVETDSWYELSTEEMTAWDVIADEIKTNTR